MSVTTMLVRALGGGASPDETYIAFLPLAHVLELAAENIVMLLGIRIAYST